MSMQNSDQNKNIALSAELVRLAQGRANRYGVPLKQELARLIAEEAVMEIDPEEELVLEGNAAMNQSEALAASLGVNDIVVSGHRIDVRVLSSESEATISRALVGSQYLTSGSLLVKLDAQAGDLEGNVVGYLSSGSWLKAEDGLRDAQQITVKADTKDDFDLVATLKEIVAKPIFNLPVAAKLGDLRSEVDKLVNDPSSLIVARQKQIFAFLCANWSGEMLELVDSVGFKLNDGKVSKVLRNTAEWSASVEKVTEKLAVRFKSLSADEIRSQIRSQGERFGGQTSPSFRKELLAALAASEMARINSNYGSKAESVMSKVLSGMSAKDAVKQLVNNSVAVDLALVIKKQRQAVEKAALGMAASAEEIGQAFQQLALKPAYATHSSSDSGVESINEALALLEASDLAERMQACDRELAEI
jgi:hypothetical protein